MAPLDVFHLPGLDPGAHFESRSYDDGAVVLRWPRLEPHHVERLAAALLAARAHTLVPVPVSRLVTTFDRVARRFTDLSDPLRQVAAAALPTVTGFHPAMVELVLDRMASDWRAPALERLLAAELGDAAALKEFVRTGARPRARAFGPRLAFHVFAGNVPGVAVTAMVRSLLVGAATLGKTASGEPVLAPLFARALADEWPQLGECIATTYWPGGSAQLEAAALDAADAVVVYGGRAATRAIRARAPHRVRVIEHGPRISFAAIARERLAGHADARSVARDAALAVALFDQQGCVSPQLVYVETGGSIDPPAFAHMLADALGAIERDLPRGRLTAAESAAIHEVRGSAEFRAIGGVGVQLHASSGTGYTVIYDPDPAFEGSCLNRVIRIKPVAALDDVASLVAPYRDVLQSVGLEAPRARLDALAGALGEAGVTRVTTLEALPWPEPHGHHDGRGPLAELVRWVDYEEAGDAR